jgi:hypothetical protein
MFYPVKAGSVLPEKARRVKGLFAAVPQIDRNLATPPDATPPTPLTPGSYGATKQARLWQRSGL